MPTGACTVNDRRVTTSRMMISTGSRASGTSQATQSKVSNRSLSTAHW